MNLGFSEMAFIFLLALIIFGPKKLPEIGRQIGKALNEFKRASNEFRSQIEHEINNLEIETPSQTILPPVQQPAGSVAAWSRPEPAAVPATEILPEPVPAPALPEPDSLSKAPNA